VFATMRAAIYDKHCNEGIGFTEDHPSPKPGSNDILIKVHAAGFNPVDFKMPDVPILGYLKKGKPGKAQGMRSRQPLSLSCRTSSPLKRHSLLFQLLRDLAGWLNHGFPWSII
jgi:hypothetical protein